MNRDNNTNKTLFVFTSVFSPAIVKTLYSLIRNEQIVNINALFGKQYIYKVSQITTKTHKNEQTIADN